MRFVNRNKKWIYFQSAGEVTVFCRSPVETERCSPTGSIMSSQSQMHAATTPNKILTDAEKLRKVILELIETERTYVKVIWVIK